jgi:hypothetical protein
VAPEPEGSSPHSQQPANGPYPEPAESTSHPTPPNQSPYGPFWSHPPIYALVFQVVFFFRAFPSNPVHVSTLSHACHMPRLPHFPLFDLPNNVWWWVQIMKLPIVQLFPFFRYFIPLRSKYYSQTNRLLWTNPMNIYVINISWLFHC